MHALRKRIRRQGGNLRTLRNTRCARRKRSAVATRRKRNKRVYGHGLRAFACFNYSRGNLPYTRARADVQSDKRIQVARSAYSKRTRNNGDSNKLNNACVLGTVLVKRVYRISLIKIKNGGVPNFRNSAVSYLNQINNYLCNKC